MNVIRDRTSVNFLSDFRIDVRKYDKAKGNNHCGRIAIIGTLFKAGAGQENSQKIKVIKIRSCGSLPFYVWEKE